MLSNPNLIPHTDDIMGEKIVRIPGETLVIDEIEPEIQYRKKHFPDYKTITGKKLLCTVCNKNISRHILNGKEIYIHSVLGVLVCSDCYNYYGDGCFSMDEDGDDKYCRWCGQGGTLYCCAKCSCAFCKKCIKNNLKRSVLDDVEEDDWECFVCKPEPLYGVRSICWAASKYYDFINDKKNEKKSDDESEIKHKRKRGEEIDDDDTSSERKIKKRKTSEKEKKEVKKKTSKGTIDENSSDNSKSRRRSSRRGKRNESESDTSESSDSDSKTTRRRKVKGKTTNVSEDEHNSKNKQDSSALKKIENKGNGGKQREVEIKSHELDESKSDKKGEEKVIKLSNVWFLESLKDISDLAKLMTKRCDQLKSNQSVNSISDVKIAFEKLNKMITGIVGNVSYINENITKNNNSFKKLIGEEVDEEKESQTVLENNKADDENNTNSLEHKDAMQSKVNESESSEAEKTEVKKSAKVDEEPSSKNAASKSSIQEHEKADKGSEKEMVNDSVDEIEKMETSEIEDESLVVDILKEKKEIKKTDKSLDGDDTLEPVQNHLKDSKTDKKPTSENGLCLEKPTDDSSDKIEYSTDSDEDLFKTCKKVKKDELSVDKSTDKEAEDDVDKEAEDDGGKEAEDDGGKEAEDDGEKEAEDDGEKEAEDDVSKVVNDLLKPSSSDELSSSEDNLSDGKSDEDFSQKKKQKKSKKKEKQDKKTTDKPTNDVPTKKSEKTDKSEEKQNKRDTENSDVDNEIDKLTDLSRIARKKRNQNTSDVESNADESMEEEENIEKSKVKDDTQAKSKTKKQKKKEETDNLLNYLDNDDESNISGSEGSVPSIHSRKSDDESNKICRQEKEETLEKEQEDLDFQLLMASSGSEGEAKGNVNSDNSDLDEILACLGDKKQRKTKGKKKDVASDESEKNEDEKEGENNDENEKKEEENMKENENETKDSISKEEPSESSFNSSDDLFEKNLRKKNRRKKWREDRLLKLKLSDTDTSEEDRKWKKRKERLKKKENNRIEEKINRKKNAIKDSEDEDKPDKKDKDSLSSVRLSSSDISSSESEEIIRKVKRKKSPSPSSAAISVSSSSEDKKVKKKRRRIKSPLPDDNSSDSETDLLNKSNVGESPGKGGRKNIRKLLDKTDLAEATKQAAKEEEERRKRIAQRQKLFNEHYQLPDESHSIEKLVLDFDVETKVELVAVHPTLVAKMKPHQAKGVKFMWDSCFESLSQLKKKKGSGCILAHCMGLGKTFQVVTLVHTVITHPEIDVKRVLIVCPLSTVLNWYNEFRKWWKDVDNAGDIEVSHLTLEKQNFARARRLKDWHNDGGVMILGYEMFRNLTAEGKKFRVKIRDMFQEALLDPGPDLIVCDEGHMLKNETTALSKAMSKIRSLRRIVLTGTPLQNNLSEYHCMVQFVRPNLLGTRKEFLNRFVNPITNGQFVDSTDQDVRVMKRRAHVLHKMLEGLVQRFDYSVLTPFLPPKHEYVISLRLSEVQIKLYQHYLDHFAQNKRDGGSSGSRLFVDFQSLSRIWTHPRAVQMSTEKAERDAQKKADQENSEDSEGSLKDFIDDSEAETSASSSKSSKESDDDIEVKSGDESKPKRSTRSTRNNPGIEEEKEKEETEEKEDKKAWWMSFVQPEELDDINHSSKLILLFAILRECEMIGDKVLVFSQSLYSLDLIEYFLSSIDTATSEERVEPSLGNNVGTWIKGLDYFRLDGSTSSENRNLWIKSFNNEDNIRSRLFLISTRAGGLGINLVGANRVVIFDASWNPSHDVQSIFRVYRFGQKKPCYIYRLIAQGTMEEKVYDRQIAKLSLSSRVIDEQQAHRHFSHNDLQELYIFTPKAKSERPVPKLPKDKLMAELLKMFEDWIETYHEHDSLIEHVVDEELNEEERKLAWEDYEKEKERALLPNPGLQGQSLNFQPFGNVEYFRAALAKRYPTASEQEIQKMLQTLMMQQYQRQQQQQWQAHQQYLQNLQKAGVAGTTAGEGSAQFNKAATSVGNTNQFPAKKLQQAQVYNYKQQLYYQNMIAQRTAGVQNTKAETDVQNKKKEDMKTPEVVDIE